MTKSATKGQPRERYQAMSADLDELLTTGLDDVAAMATFTAVVHQGLEKASWTGFYRVVAPGLLRIGPYQGPVGCLEIPFDRGVCGAAARERRSQLVDDVHRFPDHIACDPASRSEVVVPVLDAVGELVAVLDVDSHELAAFDDVDVEELEGLVAKLAPFFGSARIFEKTL
ncbi:MAG TPA: GAF domain-containing protein [Thermoanaerobaculia bacterium]|nr:GAF domain-containing protein [Thermoanaerobaculia bacterium]